MKTLNRMPVEATATDTTLGAGARPRVGRVAHLAAAVRRAFAQYRRRRARRAQARILAELDTRTLLDIGLGRCEIDSIAAELGGSTESTRRHSAERCVCTTY